MKKSKWFAAVMVIAVAFGSFAFVGGLKDGKTANEYLQLRSQPRGG
ncbi:hypothetical protein [Melghirimyces algeriensis]|nr:hypothetical protein [Melghirimyces algeriensis]